MSFSGLDLWRKKQQEEEDRRKRLGLETGVTPGNTPEWRRSYGPQVQGPPQVPQAPQPKLDFGIQVTGPQADTSTPQIGSSPVVQPTVASAVDTTPKYDPLSSMQPPKQDRPTGARPLLTPQGTALAQPAAYAPILATQVGKAADVGLQAGQEWLNKYLVQPVKDVWSQQMEDWKTQAARGDWQSILTGRSEDFNKWLAASPMGLVSQQTTLQTQKATQDALNQLPSLAGTDLATMQALMNNPNLTPQDVVRSGEQGKAIVDTAVPLAQWGLQGIGTVLNATPLDELAAGGRNGPTTPGKLPAIADLAVAAFKDSPLNPNGGWWDPTKTQGQNPFSFLVNSFDQNLADITAARNRVNDQAIQNPLARMALRNVYSGPKAMTDTATLLTQQQQIASTMDSLAQQSAINGSPWLAAAYGAQAANVRNMTPLQILDQNMNPWAELAAGVFLDLGPFGFVGDKVGEMAVKAGHVGPEVRAAKYAQQLFDVLPEGAVARVEEALKNSDQLLKAVADGGDVAKVWSDIVRPQMGPAERAADANWFSRLTPNSKADTDAAVLWQGLISLTSEFTDTRDLKQIMERLATDPASLITQGLEGVVSPKAQQFLRDGKYMFDTLAPKVGNNEFARRLPVLQLAQENLKNMASLAEDGPVNPYDFASELMGVLQDATKRVNGVDVGSLAFDAKAVRVKVLGNGTAQLEYLAKAEGKKAPKVLATGSPLSIDEANRRVRQINQALQGGMSLGDVARLPFDIQKAVMADMWLGFRPANWVRNALTGTAMLQSFDLYTAMKPVEMLQDMLAKSGNVLPSARIFEGEAAQLGKVTGGGAISQIGKMIPGKVGDAIEAFGNAPYKIPYGMTTLLDRPFGEGAMHLNAYYKSFSRAFRKGWNAKVFDELAPQLAQLNLPPDMVDTFLKSVYDAGLHADKAGVLSAARDIVHGATIKTTLSDLGILPETLSLDGARQLQEILKSSDVGQATTALRQLIDNEKKWAENLLAAAPPQPGNYSWTKDDLLNESSALGTWLKNYAKKGRMGDVSPEVQQVVDSFTKTFNETFTNLGRDITASGKFNIGPIGDFFNDVRDMRMKTRAAVDTVNNTAVKVGTEEGWKQAYTDTRTLYQNLVEQVQAKADEYRTLIQSGQTYTPKWDWGQVVEQYANFDPNEWARLNGLDLLPAEFDTPLFTARNTVNRQYVDNSLAHTWEAFKRYPSIENFDILRDTLFKFDAYGAMGKARVNQLGNMLQEGKITRTQFREMNGKVWREVMEAQSLYAKAQAYSMVKLGEAAKAATGAVTNSAEALANGMEAVGKAANQAVPVVEDAIKVVQAAANGTGPVADQADETLAQMANRLRPGQPPIEAVKAAVNGATNGANNLAEMGSNVGQAISENLRKAWRDSVFQTGKLPQAEIDANSLIAQLYDRMRNVAGGGTKTLDEAINLLEQSGGNPDQVKTLFKEWTDNLGKSDTLLGKVSQEDWDQLTQLRTQTAQAVLDLNERLRLLPATATDQAKGLRDALDKEMGLMARIDGLMGDAGQRNMPVAQEVRDLLGQTATPAAQAAAPAAEPVVSSIAPDIARVLNMMGLDGELDVPGKVAEAAANAFDPGVPGKYLEAIAQLNQASRDGIAAVKGMDMADVGHEMWKNLDALGKDLEARLPQLLQGTPNTLSPAQRLAMVNAVDKWVGNYDIAVAQAHKVGEKVSDWAMLNFNSRRNIDTVLGVLGPFPYFWSRMPGKALQMAMAKPSLVGLMYDTQRAMRLDAQQQGTPQSFQTTLPVPGTNLRVPTDWIFRSIVPMQGYIDPSPFDYVSENEPSQFKQWANGVLKALPLGPLQQVVANAAMGNGWKPPTLGSMVPLAQVAGYTYMWARGELERPTWFMTGDQWDGGRVGEMIALLPTTGLTPEQRQIAITQAQGIVESTRAGKPIPPNQASDQAWALFFEANSQTGMDRFISVASSLLGLPVRVLRPEEVQLRQEQQMRRGLGNSPDNPYGSQAAVDQYDAMTGDAAKNFGQYNSLYPQGKQTPVPPGVAFNQPFTGETSLAIKGIVQAYQAAKNKVYDQFDAEREQWVAQHPGIDEFGMRAFENGDGQNPGWYDRRQQALDALDAQFPQAMQAKKDPNADFYGNMNLAERNLAVAKNALSAAEEALKAKAPVYPENGTAEQKRQYRVDKAAWDKAVLAQAQAYLSDPKWIEQSMHGRVVGDNTRTVGASPFPQVPGASPLPPLAGGHPTLQSETTGEVRVVKGQVQGPEGVGLPPKADQVVPRLDSQAKENPPLPPIGGNPLPGAPVSREVGGQTIPQTPQALGGNQWADKMAEEEQRYGLPAGMLQALAQHESNFDPQAKSGAGAVGLMQFMPGTWAGVAKVLGLNDITNPEQSIEASAYYLRQLYDGLPEDKKTWEWALAAYNAGPARVAKAQTWNDIPAETRPYVAGIMAGTQTGQPQTAGWVQPFGSSRGETQTFGANPKTYEQYGFAGHEGLDFGMPVGTPLYAVEGATVEFAGDKGNNYGNYVVLKLPDGKLAYYAHMDKIDVKAGDTVAAGQQIGESGNSGNTTGPHLHFGLLDPAQANNGYRGFVDPTPYLQQGGQQIAAVGNVPSGGAGPAEPGSTAPWNLDLAALQQQGREQNMGPNRLAAEGQFQAQEQAQVDKRLKVFGPQAEQLYQQYYMTVSDEDRLAFRQQHPEIKAINLMTNDPEAYASIEKKWGQGAAMLWANIPPSDMQGGGGQRSAYYQQHPESFLVKAWLEGRPQPFTDEQSGSEKYTGYNVGNDYAQAIKLFGKDIWDIVREAQTLPDYDPANKATGKIWGDFHDKYPQYSAWSDWWYALLPDNGKSQSKGGYGFGYSGGGYTYKPQSRVDINPVQSYRTRYNPEAPAKYEGGGSSMGEGWRKWLSLSEPELKNWRR